MTDWVIQRGKSIPKANYRPGQSNGLRSAFDGIEVGESIFSATIDRMTMTNAYRKVVADSLWKKKFVSRAVKGGSEVWRVS